MLKRYVTSRPPRCCLREPSGGFRACLPSGCPSRTGQRLGDAGRAMPGVLPWCCPTQAAAQEVIEPERPGVPGRSDVIVGQANSLIRGSAFQSPPPLLPEGIARVVHARCLEPLCAIPYKSMHAFFHLRTFLARLLVHGRTRRANTFRVIEVHNHRRRCGCVTTSTT